MRGTSSGTTGGVDRLADHLEHVGQGRAEEDQDDDRHERRQREYQAVLDNALTAFAVRSCAARSGGQGSAGPVGLGALAGRHGEVQRAAAIE